MKKVLLSGLVAGIAMAVVGMVCNMLWQKLLPGLEVQYQAPLFRPWSDPLMSLIFVVPVLSGFVMASAWKAVGGKLCFCEHDVKDVTKNILGFVGFFIVLSVLGMLMTYSCFPMSFLMLVTWCVSMVVEYLVGTWILAKMIK